ncbi:MAG: helix-turn-helix domain-containing protein [Acidobacteriota bacterium]
MTKGRSYPKGGPEPSFIAETAVQYGMPQQQLEQALWLADRLLPEELELAKTFPKLEALDPEHRGRLANSMRRTLEGYLAKPSSDPLADVDPPLAAEEEVAATLWADLEAENHRARLLSECVSSEQAGQLTGRSRQAVERLRRDGRLVALRVGRQWRYPAWQFDVDGPGGLVPHLPEVLAALPLSPLGAAYWLSTPNPELDDAPPIRRLRQRQPASVLQLAQRLSHLP